MDINAAMEGALPHLGISTMRSNEPPAKPSFLLCHCRDGPDAQFNSGPTVRDMADVVLPEATAAVKDVVTDKLGKLEQLLSLPEADVVHAYHEYARQAGDHNYAVTEEDMELEEDAEEEND